MSAVQSIPGDKVAEILKQHKCRKVAPVDDTQELWATENGHHFVVPASGPDKLCPKYKLYKILSDIESHSS